MTESAHYVVYGSARWHEPWLTEQNLARALARKHRVLYVEPPMTPLSPVRYGIRRESRAQAAALVHRRRRADGVELFSPIVLPPRTHPRARALSAPLLARQVRGALTGLGFQHPVAVTAQWAPGLIGAAGESSLVAFVKDWVEAGADLLGRDPRRLASDRDRLLAAADLVCATSRNLQTTLRARGVDAELVRHGFHSDLAAVYDAAEPPAEYAHLPRPLLGYTGRIDERLDFDVLDALADRFAGGSVVLVGPVSPRLPAEYIDRLHARPNLHLLGPRTRDDSPRYVAYLDCCLMPYRETEWLYHGSPLKLWDYLYAGPPLVGSGCPALLDFPPPLVNFATGARNFANAVERALGDDRDSQAATRREVALANTWEQRAEQLHALVTGGVSSTPPVIEQR